MLARAVGFIKRRLCERSSINHLITGLAAAGAFWVGDPRLFLFTLLALTAWGFLVPDGRVKGRGE